MAEVFLYNHSRNYTEERRSDVCDLIYKISMKTFKHYTAFWHIITLENTNLQFNNNC